MKGKLPYVERIGKNCESRYSQQAVIFYNQVWKERQLKSKKHPNKDVENTEFFNLCKIILLSLNKDLAAECYAAEALNRYISSMFFALGIAIILMVSAVLIVFIYSGNISILLLSVAGIYFVAEIIIVWRYRFIRVKEADTVFAAMFAMKDKILPLLGEELNISKIINKINISLNQLFISPDRKQPVIRKLVTELREAIFTSTDLEEEAKWKALEQVKAIAEAGKNPSSVAIWHMAKKATTMLREIIAR